MSFHVGIEAKWLLTRRTRENDTCREVVPSWHAEGIGGEMPFIRPSLVLQAMLTPANYTPETEREIKRSYNFIASAIVKQLEGDAAADGNIMQFRIRLMKPYWDTSDAAARELWDAVMPRWLHNQALNVTTAMRNYNTVTHNPGAKNVTYAWADFEFNNF